MSSVDIVIRAYNDMPVIEETLRAVRNQSQAGHILVMDNASEDGTTAVATELADRVITVPAGAYVPGAVLNEAMEETDSEYVVFLNSDCTPLDDQWLEGLLSGFDSKEVVAVFGRQVPRPDCLPLFAKDTNDTFGDGAMQATWRHCFSMASSAIRRSTWQAMPFNPEIQYSEDIEWTWRARQQGGTIRYCPESRVYHSHNYTLKQWHRRQYGEGKADAKIFDWTPWERAWLRYSALPCVRQVLSDWKYAIKRRALGAIIYSPAMRVAQMLGRRKGFNAGLQD